MNSETNMPSLQAKPDQDEIAAKLSTGLLKLYEPYIENVNSTISELICKQHKIEKDMIEENSHFAEAALILNQDMMNTIRVYRDKLTAIRKQMLNIHHKTRNLKKRSAFLEEFKAKELDDKIQRRQHEQALIANNGTTTVRPTSSPPPDY